MQVLSSGVLYECELVAYQVFWYTFSLIPIDDFNNLQKQGGCSAEEIDNAKQTGIIIIILLILSDGKSQKYIPRSKKACDAYGNEDDADEQKCRYHLQEGKHSLVMNYFLMCYMK